MNIVKNNCDQVRVAGISTIVVSQDYLTERKRGSFFIENSLSIGFVNSNRFKTFYFSAFNLPIFKYKGKFWF